MNRDQTQPPEPLDLRWEESNTVVGIDWSDGHRSRYPTDYLRRVCPCAVCQDAHAEPPLTVKTHGKPAFRILTDAQLSLAQAVSTVKEAFPVGNYALGLRFSDGHDDGIYSWRYLRAVCPCKTCEMAREAQAIGRAGGKR